MGVSRNELVALVARLVGLRGRMEIDVPGTGEATVGEVAAGNKIGGVENDIARSAAAIRVCRQ